MLYEQTFGLLWVIVVLILQKISATPTWYTASDGNSYLIEAEEKFNWLQAYNLCARQDLQLVVIDSAAKNAAIDTLMRSIFAKAPNIWLGSHDELNSKDKTTRPFYAISSGQKMPFTNWAPNEPNNLGANEHCAHFYHTHNFQWNDISCTYLNGYICEKNHLTVRYQKDLQQKRINANEQNKKVSLQYVNTDNEINSVLKAGHNTAMDILLGFDVELDEIMAESKSSIAEIVKSKPYLEAVVADVGELFAQILVKTHTNILQASKVSRESIQNVHFNVENTVNEELKQFEGMLSVNTNEIDNILI